MWGVVIGVAFLVGMLVWAWCRTHMSDTEWELRQRLVDRIAEEEDRENAA